MLVKETSLDDMERIASSINEYVSIDIETSHLHPDKGAMIIEVGAVRIKDNKVVDTFSQLIDPERRITAKITEITGITNEMLKGQPKYREVLPDFYEFLGDSVLIGHNAMFDWDRFLLHFFKKVGIYPKNQVIDTLKLSRKHFPKNEGGHNLKVLCEKLNISNENAHRATDDALATARLFYYLKKNFIGDDLGNQISLLGGEAAKAKAQQVRKIAYWEKEIKKGKMMKRAYVTLDRSVVFYDIPTKAWEVKSSNEPIDFKEVEKGVCSMLKLQNIEQLEIHFQAN